MVVYPPCIAQRQFCEGRTEAPVEPVFIDGSFRTTMQNAPLFMQEALPYPVFALETRFRIPSFDDKSIAYLSKKRQAMTTLYC